MKSHADLLMDRAVELEKWITDFKAAIRMQAWAGHKYGHNEITGRTLRESRVHLAWLERRLQEVLQEVEEFEEWARKSNELFRQGLERSTKPSDRPARRR